jgi:predicted RNase H-like HicB family nuclease
MTKRQRRQQHFTVVIERDEDGLYVASVPSLEGCHTQGKSLDEVVTRMREAVELWLEVNRGRRAANSLGLEFVGIQRIRVPA